MDFDSIMVVLVVIYFIWRSITEAKQKMKNRENTVTGEQSGNEFLEKLFDVNEPVAFTLDERITTPKAPKTEVDYLAKGLKKKKKRPRQQQNKKTAAVQEPVVAPPPSFKRRRSINRKRLREAVIWSELLDRPLALRDKQRTQGL